MVQIVVGGLGFGVMLELLGLPVLRPWRWRKGRGRLGVQTKVVLLASAVLIVVGAVLLYALERNNPATLGDPALGAGARVQAAAFQSVTARTAGFNTVPIGDLTDGSKFLLVLLMVIGASPGSTGGGLKTVTVVVLLMSIVALIRGRPRVELFRRSIPRETVRRATVIVVAAVAFLSAGTFLVTAVEGGRFPFLSILFETGSAFGTVGLSTGITASLSPVSKLVMCLLMLVGRIGPLSLVIALSQARERRPAEYPEEHVMIG
jgi:trk system potassium uptake protein TrkH